VIEFARTAYTTPSTLLFVAVWRTDVLGGLVIVFAKTKVQCAREFRAKIIYPNIQLSRLDNLSR
jgi:hypothetical protein